MEGELEKQMAFKFTDKCVATIMSYGLDKFLLVKNSSIEAVETVKSLKIIKDIHLAAGIPTNKSGAIRTCNIATSTSFSILVTYAIAKHGKRNKNLPLLIGNLVMKERMVPVFGPCMLWFYSHNEVKTITTDLKILLSEVIIDQNRRADDQLVALEELAIEHARTSTLTKTIVVFGDAVPIPLWNAAVDAHKSRVATKMRCSNCKVSFKENLKKCAKCKTAHYCSGLCQTQDWPKHKEFCKEICI